MVGLKLALAFTAGVLVVCAATIGTLAFIGHSNIPFPGRYAILYDEGNSSDLLDTWTGIVYTCQRGQLRKYRWRPSLVW